MAYEEDFREAARLEHAGDAESAAGRPAAALYRAAQTCLMPCKRVWEDRSEYDRHVHAYERLQNKLFELAPVVSDTE